jgi:hypothetical protein
MDKDKKTAVLDCDNQEAQSEQVLTKALNRNVRNGFVSIGWGCYRAVALRYD